MWPDTLPLHADSDLGADGATVAEVFETGAGKGFTVGCITLIGPSE